MVDGERGTLAHTVTRSESMSTPQLEVSESTMARPRPLMSSGPEFISLGWLEAAAVSDPDQHTLVLGQPRHGELVTG